MSDDRKSPPGLLIASNPPKRLDDEYVRRKLDAISRAQARQAQIEAERTGAARNVSRLVATFGALITAGAIALFGWVWQTSAATSRHESAIERVSERQLEHDPTPLGHADIEASIRENDRRIIEAHSATKQINARLDRIEREGSQRHREVLDELRRLRTRMWRGGSR